jgi:hypothetical protein
METTTTDHEEIKRWAIVHQGNPQLLDHAQAEGDKMGIRINFPGPEDDEYLSTDHPPKDISWEEFFRIFDEQELAFVYDTDHKGDPSLGYRFSNR